MSLLWLLLSPVEAPDTNDFFPTLASVCVYIKEIERLLLIVDNIGFFLKVTSCFKKVLLLG